MHYKLAPGIIVKSENAAKPDTQASAFVKTLLADLSPVSSTFDYGCGKLRYKSAILKSTETLTLVDSKIQLSRKQKLLGKDNTIFDLAQRSNHLSAQTIEQFESSPTVYDRGFCINVLSVVPFKSVRRSILQNIRDKLRPGASCLFAVQYRNSDFTRMRRMENARQWRDGFLIDSLRGFSFYGLIPPDGLKKMAIRARFNVLSQRLNEGSVYLWAERPREAITVHAVGDRKEVYR
jgi:SAM-dependent methyltransferase